MKVGLLGERKNIAPAKNQNLNLRLNSKREKRNPLYCFQKSIESTFDVGDDVGARVMKWFYQLLM